LTLLIGSCKLSNWYVVRSYWMNWRVIGTDYSLSRFWSAKLKKSALVRLFLKMC
jgi:hypothetical protein